MVYKKQGYLIIELLTIFILTPALIYFLSPHHILPVLWILALYCTIILVNDPTFLGKKFWHFQTSHSFKVLLIQFLVFTIILLGILYIFLPEHLFSLMKSNPLLWGLILVFYPLLSVYPQEIIYRGFYFHRYRNFITQPSAMIITNALLFGYMHIIFHNFIAVILTTIGGMFFAKLYQRSSSLIFVSVLHALYGNLVFTLGLGQYFFYGNIDTICEIIKL
ncbi:MAG: CPBP family intramembrane metalloprotease [Campylobacterales bacterium]|nr:CPBP family intramembrane metalloprotease [Campylobacterales bacterium]